MCQQSPLQAASSVEDASTALLLISGTDSISKYLDDPKVVCTGFLPTNEVRYLYTRAAAAAGAGVAAATEITQ
jgi:hypothetical protein